MDINTLAKSNLSQPKEQLFVRKYSLQSRTHNLKKLLFHMHVTESHKHEAMHLSEMETPLCPNTPYARIKDKKIVMFHQLSGKHSN
jgi:hypothetical protein